MSSSCCGSRAPSRPSPSWCGSTRSDAPKRSPTRRPPPRPIRSIPTTKYFLNRFVNDFHSRRRATVEEHWTRSLRFLSTELANAAFARDGDDVAATAAGTAETERQVERVVLRIHPSPEPPHGATADFELVHLAGGQEVLRERWSVALRFEFLDRVPPELVVHNPMGILITYLQADRALVTEDPR